MAAKQKKYASSHAAKINSNCEVSFNKTNEAELHVKIDTFGEDKVVLTEETFLKVLDAYNRYKELRV